MTTRKSNFLEKNFGTVVFIAIAFVGQVASYGILQSRVGSIEFNVAHGVTRPEYMENVRRIETLEKELVPRNEHLLREAEINKRLDEIHDSIKDVRERLEIIDTRQRGK